MTLSQHGLTDLLTQVYMITNISVKYLKPFEIKTQAKELCKKKVQTLE